MLLQVSNLAVGVIQVGNHVVTLGIGVFPLGAYSLYRGVPLTLAELIGHTEQDTGILVPCPVTHTGTVDVLLHQVKAQVNVEVDLLGDGKAVKQTGLHTVVAAVVRVIVCTIFPRTVRNGTGARACINPVNGHTDVPNAVVETVGLIAGQPVGYVEQYVANKTEVIEVLGNILATIELAGPVAVTQGGVVAGPGSTLDLLKVHTGTQTQNGGEPFTYEKVCLGTQTVAKVLMLVVG